MVMRPLARYSARFLFAFSAIAMIAAATNNASASLLDKDTCERLESERQAMIVLGIDKYFEKGSDWAKANLTVADLNLVKRYLDVYEQLTFRCKEELNIVELDEPDDEQSASETVSNGPAPPLPVRRPADLAKASAASKSSDHDKTPAATQAGTSGWASRAIKARPANLTATN